MDATITALIADDEPDMLDLARTMIQLGDPNITIVDEARNGEEALTKWRALSPPPVPTVVVLDNRMPGLTGVDVAREMRSELPDQPVILFSAYLDDAVREQAAEIGIARCVAKNDVEDLHAVIREVAANGSA